MIECGTRKIIRDSIVYWKATLTIGKQTITSTDYFCTKKTARKHAEFWKYDVVNSRPRKEV